MNSQHHLNDQFPVKRRPLATLCVTTITLFGLIGFSYYTMGETVLIPLLASLGMATVTLWWFRHLRASKPLSPEVPSVPHKR